MPPAIGQKTPEVSKKPPFEQPHAVESKKSLSEFASKSVDYTSRPTGGAGETVTKKPAKKSVKSDDEKVGKKTNSGVVDRVPKKNAQRAKGSTSLNKTIEKTNAEPTEKKRAFVESPEKTETPKEENDKTGADGRKIPTKASKTKTATKKSAKKESKIPRTPQSWMNAKQQTCNIPEQKQEEEAPKEEVPEAPQEEIRAVNGPFNSCSFFEKIQQGVKAYFSSRNSFTPGDKNKKEGGSQTRARVANGVKEDATKREPGFVFKNKISDSFHEQLRVNSSLGGESNNFSRAKPVKIFRKLKRKKLYRPKKHCVRIQIPRKGYFYRSTVQFKAPESTTSGQFHRLEPTGVPKSEPKVQISGLASTGSKKPDLPNKKRLKKKKLSTNAFDRPDETANRRFVEKLAEGERQKSRMGDYVSERESVQGDSFGTLVNCLNSTLDKDLIYDLEITPVSKIENVFACNTAAITETPLQLTNVIKSSNKPEPATLFISPVPSTWEVEERSEPFNPTAVLMDGIDLHFELQNYLKAFDSKSNFSVGSPNRTHEFDELSDNISSFESATSIPEDLMMLERDTASASEDCIVTIHSQTEIRKIKSQNDPRTLSLRTKSPIKRTFGKTSFEELQFDGDFFSRLLSPLKELSENDNSIDSYEKILPLGNSNSESKPKNKNNVLYENIMYALSDESVSRSIRKFASDTNQSQITRTELTQPVQPTLQKESSSSEMILPNSISQWSPTLQDLTEIYDNVLKHHQKLKKNSRYSVKNCSSTQLFSFLKKKIKEKQCKADLIKLSKGFSSNYSPSNQWKSIKGNDSTSLKECVAKFQELLHSSLSIKHITRMNKIITNFQSITEKSRQKLKESAGSTNNIEAKNEKKLKRTPKKQLQRKSKAPAPTNKKPDSPKPNKPLKPKSPPKRKLQNVKLSSPTELDLMLNSEKLASIDPDLTDAKNKMMVTVKLRGDQVLVNGLTYFDSETVLPSKKTKQKGTSQLIIENVTKDQINGVWFKKTKSSKLREQFHSGIKAKKPEKKPRKVKAIKKVKQKKTASTIENDEQRQQENELETILQYHYDQMVLRAQHPIDAIIESSESKLNEQVENSEESKSTERPSNPELDREVVKEALKNALAENMFSKDLFWNFDWREEEEIETFLTRTKSSVITRQQIEQRQMPAMRGKKKRVEAVQSMIDLKNGKDRNVLPRPRTTYFCFPTVHKLQEMSGQNKKPKGRSPSPPKSPIESQLQNSGAIEPTTKKLSTVPSNTVLYLNSEVIPECCSIELLFSEDINNASVGSKLSVCVASEKETFEPVNRSLSQDVTAPPIVLHPHRSTMDDFSFPSMIIHSDSFLRCIQHSDVTKSELETLLKSNSDMKFYPGRVTDSGTEEKPFVTFVLTPEQKEAAGVSEDKIQVVKKTIVAKDVPVVDVETEEETETKSYESREEIPLDSIENFINELSKCRARVARQKLNNRSLISKSKTKSKPARSRSTSPKYAQKKKPLLGQISQIFYSFNNKSPQQRKPQMRATKKPPAKVTKKLPQKIFKKPASRTVKVTGKSASKAIRITGKPVKKVEKVAEKPKQKIRHLRRKPEASEILENAINDFSKMVKNRPEQKKPEETDLRREDAQQTNGKANRPDIPFEVVEELKTALARTEDFPNKSEIIAAIGKAFEKQETPSGRADPPRKLKIVKIKIHCNEHRCLKESRDAGIVTEEFFWGDKTPPPPPPTPELLSQGPQTSAEIELLDSLVMRERNGKDLEKKSSTYFDAVEKTLRDEGAGKEMGDSRKVQKKRKDELFYPKDVFPEEPEEVFLNKISQLLKEDDISYAMALLDVFLNKTESYPGKSSAKLKELLLLVENKSKNLMMKMERSAWLKVLSLLEEVAQVFESEDADFKKAHIQTTKDFVDKIQNLNISRLVDLQNFCSSLSRPPTSKSSANVFGRIRKSLKLLQQKFKLKRLEFESSDSDSRSELRIHSTVSLPEVREAFVEKTEVERLKKKIQQQKSCIEQLIKSDSEPVPPEIQDVKDKVSDKMKTLERIFARFELDEKSKEKKGWRQKEESFPSLYKGPAKDRESTYVDLIQCLMKDDEDNLPIHELTLTSSCSASKSRTNVKSTKSLVRVQSPSVRILDSRNEIPGFLHDEMSTSKTEHEIYTKSRDKMRQLSRATLAKDGKVLSTPEFLVNDCWKVASTEIPVNLVEIFKDNSQEEDSDVTMKKRKLTPEDCDCEKLSYTKEFHVLSEVQKAKILTAVEDAIKKLANSDVNDLLQVTHSRRMENPSYVSDASNIEKYLCKKFLLPWVIMKLVEMVLCHVTQMTFLSNDSFFQRKNEFLPVVVTYYLTLFIVVVSLVLHIGCYSYVGIQNPCYFMGVISSSILTLTTTLGILVLLCLMEYYRSFQEILVLIFIGALLGTLVVELCICYMEVKNFWNRVGHAEQYFVP